jgi:Peptidase family M28
MRVPGYDPGENVVGVETEPEDGRTATVRCRVTLAVLLVSVLGVILGCGAEEVGTGDATSTTAQRSETTAQRGETTARKAEEASNVEPPNVAEAAAAGIGESAIRAHLSHLTGASPAPLEGGAATIAERGSERGRWAAARYMEQSFERLGIPARVLEFTSDYGRGFNVEATLRGSGGGKHLWVTAHMDSVSNAGANDNASGLVSILMTARALKRLDPEHTVHFVAYDLEEVGLVGSSAYVGDTVAAIREQEGDRAIIGNINNDMVGYESGRFDAVVGTCGRAGPIDDALLRASEMLDSRIELREVCLGRSDHQHFWDAGLPAAVLTDGSIYDDYPCYHEPCDTLDKLNVSYLRSVIRLTAAATALLAAPQS